MERKENAMNPHVFFSFERCIYIYSCDSSFTESTSSFDGVELMRNTWCDFQGLKTVQDQALYVVFEALLF